MSIQIEEFSVRWMRNEEHYGYMSMMSDTATKLTDESMARVVTPFRMALTAEDEALEVDHKSELTEAVVTADVTRDNAWRSLYLLALSASLSPDEKLAAAGKRLLSLFDRYGDPRDMPYTQANGVYKNLIADLGTEEYVTELTAIQGGKQYELLVSAQDAFYTHFTNRNAEQAAVGSSRVKETRAAVDVAWRNLCQYVIVIATIEGEVNGVGEFIAEVNKQIAYQRSVKANRDTLNAKKREEEETVPEEDTPEPTA